MSSVMNDRGATFIDRNVVIQNCKVVIQGVGAVNRLFPEILRARVRH